MGAVIDADVLLAAERGALSLEEILDPKERVVIAAVTASRLLQAAHRTADPVKRSQRTAFVEQLLERVEVVAFDALAARAHSEIRSERNGALPPADVDLAATALARGWRVVTYRHLNGIPGLEVVNP